MAVGIANYPNYPKGATVASRQFTITETVSDVTTPVDLTNVTIKVDFVKCQERIELTVGSGLSMLDAVNGVFRIDELVFDSAGIWQYDVKITFFGTTVKKWIAGSIRIVESYTN